MKKSNYIVLAVAAIAAAVLLFIWFYRGFYLVDNPLDLVLAIVWWLLIVAVAYVITRAEAKRKRSIRTVYVSPTALYNPELGVVGLGKMGQVQAIEDMLVSLKYGFDTKTAPEKAKFDYRFVVQTDEYEKDGDNTTWKGTVIKIDRENGNVETKFNSIEQLTQALAA